MTNSFIARQIGFVVILFFISVSTLQGQSPYKLSGWKESAIIGGSVGSLTLSRSLYKKMEPISLKELDQLKRSDVFAIDRWATHQYSGKARKFSDILLHSSYAIPLTMLAGERSRKDFGKGSLFLLETLLINSAITDMTKVLAKRNRPLVYNEFVEANLKLTRGNRTSFFSGHTSTVASMYFLTAKLYSDYYPNSDLKPVVWSAAVLIPATTGLMRMKGGKHYFTDVLTGFAVGALVGILVPEIHKIGN